MSWNTCPPCLTIIPSHPCPCFKIQLKWFLIQVMPNQTWVCPLARRKNVPTLGFVEAKYSVYCKENGQLMFKRPKLPQAFQGRYFKGKVEKKNIKARWEKQLRCLWASHGRPWLVGDDVNRWYFRSQPQQSPGVYVLVINMQLTSSIWWEFRINKTHKDMTQNIICSPWGGTRGTFFGES